MKQKVLNDGQIIFKSILEELSNAKKEILLAMTWFTDDVLFSKLIEKAEDGVIINIVIADKEENKKLDFKKLSEFTTVNIVYKKGALYSGMNSKYCVIDKNIAISGSYNWSISARSNYDENVIITDYAETVKSFHDRFYDLFQDSKFYKKKKRKGLFNWLKKIFKKVGNNENYDDNKKNSEDINVSQYSENDVKYEIDEILESIVITEIKKINRTELIQFGKDNVEKVNGDANVLVKIMDSLYHLFICDSNNIEEKKENLKTKINSKIDELSENVNDIYRRKIIFETENNSSTEKEYKFKQLELKKEIEILEISNSVIDTDKIPKIENHIKSIEEGKLNMDVEFIKPLKKRFIFIPQVLIAFGLGIGLFIFYLSCTYIMFYAYNEALAKINSDINQSIEIFVPDAFFKVYYAGGPIGLIYSILFIFIPFSIGFWAHDSVGWKKILGWLGIFIIDFTIAFKVNQSRENINSILISGLKQEIPYFDRYFEIGLIFFLGAAPLFVFVFFLKKIIFYYNERHPSEEIRKIEIKKNQLVNEILSNEAEIYEFENDVEDNKKKIIELVSKRKFYEIKEIYLPKEFQACLTSLEYEQSNKIAYIKKKGELFKNTIDNDTVPISLPALKDRVNLFLEGWNEWLHDEFSRDKAIDLSDKARIKADDWLNQNIEHRNDNVAILKYN